MSQKVKSHVVSNIVYLLKTIWQWDKAYAFLLAAQILIFVSLPLTGLYLSKFAAEASLLKLRSKAKIKLNNLAFSVYFDISNKNWNSIYFLDNECYNHIE